MTQGAKLAMNCASYDVDYTPSTTKPLSVCLINPKFEPSFWGFDFALPLLPGDKRCWVVTGALPSLAALAPRHCTVEILDENVETIDFESLARFDVIGVTGMIVQGERMCEILRELKRLPGLVAVGGPYMSVAESLFEDLCDIRFVGEADETWPLFLNALGAGAPIERRYEQAEKTDMRTVPVPRYDLIKSDRYMMAALQFSRGCPFTCEFCDIITIFGRRPRLKGIDQMIEEFEAVRRAGFRLCFLVDDNLIGNKGEAKKLLAALADWQQAHGYPLQLFVEASINLAEDDDLIELMVRANIRQVFIGIESPRMSSLAETKKIQNIRGASLLDKVRRIRDGGLVVKAGFIVGFDNDDEGIFQDQFDFIQEAGIAQALVAILSPIPTTPLHARLAAAGRLDPRDPDVAFVPARMSQATLKREYDLLVQRLYEPDAYFRRLLAGYAGSPGFRARRAVMEAQMAGRGGVRRSLARTVGSVSQAWRLGRALIRAGMGRQLGAAYVRTWLTLNRPLHQARVPLGAFIGLCVVHWHLFRMANHEHKGRFGKVADAAVPDRPEIASAA